VTALLVCFAIMGVCVVVILSATPELLAATAVAGIILGAQYALPFSDWNRTMDQNALNIEMRDGKPYITNAPAPERIEISRGLYDQILEEAPPIGDAPEEDDPRWVWVEEIQHAGTVDADGEYRAQDNDGYMLHFDAQNVACSYRVASVPEEGSIIGVLASWGEK
jgi:hypothetical protein